MTGRRKYDDNSASKHAAISRPLPKSRRPSASGCFEYFRQTCVLDYGLDPAHYYTLPGFTFDACLKFTEQELDLFTDNVKFFFIENSIRGGISVVNHRHAKVINPFVITTNPTPTSLSWMLITFTVEE